jgi:pyridoxamine 5'-phosphate oxidase
MNRQEILTAVKKVPYAFVATIDGNEPRVRGMEIFRVDENGIIFYTSKPKDVCKQLTQNPNVEICVFEPQSGLQVRIRGKMETVEDNQLKKEICGQRPFLQYLGNSEEDVCKGLTVFRLRNGKASTWTMATATTSTVYVDF